jgi:hypothetical protein
MRVIVGCEYSGRVRQAFRDRGHDAWSCDLLPSEDDSPFHIQGDLLAVIDGGWDLGIFHPPCTDLAVSGARHFAAKIADGRQQKSLEFVARLMGCKIPKWALENPISIISSHFRKPDQVIQPWQFGHGEVKATCLWLHNLPPLIPTHCEGGDLFTLPAPPEREQRVWKMPPGPNRWKEHSRTYQGVADQMAAQWGKHL